MSKLEISEVYTTSGLRKCKDNTNRRWKSNRAKEISDELTESPISGTYIIKEWNKNQMPKNISLFSTAEIELNSIAHRFVKDTPQIRAELKRIPNLIGAYECKLCKTV